MISPQVPVVIDDDDDEDFKDSAAPRQVGGVKGKSERKTRKRTRQRIADSGMLICCSVDFKKVYIVIEIPVMKFMRNSKIEYFILHVVRMLIILSCQKSC